MRRSMVVLSVFAGACFGLMAQHRVSQEHQGHKVWALVPLTGKGTAADPRRPLLIPTPAEEAATQANRIAAKSTAVPDLLGFTMQLSDDGKSALVEFTFSSPVAYHNFLIKSAARPEISARHSESEIDNAKLNRGETDGKDIKNLAAKTKNVQTAMQAAVPGLLMFERGKTTESEVQTEFRKHKANFQFGEGKNAVDQGVAQ